MQVATVDAEGYNTSAMLRERLRATAKSINDWAGLWGVVIGIVGLIAGVAIGVWSVRKSEDLARRAGDLAHPRLQLYLGEWPINADTEMVLQVGAPFESNSLTLLTLPLRIGNVSTRTAEDITVTAFLPELIRGGIAENTRRKIAKVDPGLQMTEARNTIGNFEVLSYHFTRLNPRSGVSIDEAFAFPKETALTVPVPERGVVVNLSYAYTLDFRISQKDREPQQYRIALSTVKAASFAELQRAVQKEIVDERIKLRARTSFREYLAVLISRRTQTRYIAFAPPKTVTPVGDQKFVEAATFGGAVARLEYSSASWSLLFRK